MQTCDRYAGAAGGGGESSGHPIFGSECDLERVRALRKETDRYGPPMPFNTKPGVFRDWRRPELYRKNFASAITTTNMDVRIYFVAFLILVLQ